MPAKKDIVNKKFGRLTAIRPTVDRQWECLCECGATVSVSRSDLLSGHTKSCGCLKRDVVYNRIPSGRAGFFVVFKNYKRHAVGRNLEFNLSIEEFFDMTQRDCFYCGVEPCHIAVPQRQTAKGNFLYNGVDRLDNSIGYTSSNCVTCCGVCNKMKGTQSVENFINKINAIHARMLAYKGN